MIVTLPADLAAIVARLRATGQFEDDAAVLRAALVDLDRKAKVWAEKHAALKAAITEGLEGPFEPWDIDDIRREVAERLAGRAAAE
jgi:Arc/MetJ-type ribon-helix-helix transcriptional regulator